MNIPAFNGEKRAVRILIVDDHPVVREGLAARIATQSDMVACAEVGDVAAALEALQKFAPDVAVVDVSLQSGNGLDLIKRMKDRSRCVRPIAWSMYPERLYAERALRAGAMGYVHKGRETREILHAIRAVLAGRLYLSEELSSGLLHRLVGKGDGPEDRSPVDSLSDRELEAFQLMGEGLTTEQIAERMHISPKTVETYRLHIKEKLNVRNSSTLIQQATRWVLENQ
jgi:DNA-binding NarL/FixJ family response regulator